MNTNGQSAVLSRVETFTRLLGIRMPILLAPMAGACPPSLSIAVANAGGLGACGALLMEPEAIRAWGDEFRQHSEGEFQLNLWVRGPAPVRDREQEARQREFLAAWGPAVALDAGDAVLPDFDAQCQAMLEARPRAISSIMGVYPPSFVAEMKSRGILWFAVATIVAEARAAEAAGADAIVAQGAEAGGHRGAFNADKAESQMVGLLALIPQVADAVQVPVIATGGIGDGRGVAAALLLGASAVQIGTGFLRAPEAKLDPTYAQRLGRTEAHETVVTRAFTGRAGRAALNRYVQTAAAADAPAPAPYPIQRGFTRAMQQDAIKAADAERMQMWAGQAAKLALPGPAAEIAQRLWEDARQLLSP
jgi:nitronate monooxygenase